MKPVDYEHFARFLAPNTLTARGDELYFCVRRADFDDNDYKSDLYVFKGGELRQLTSSGDVNAYYLLRDGIVFPALRKSKDKEAAQKGVPLTVYQLLPYTGGEAREWLRLPYAVEDIRFLSEKRFFFTARFSFAYDAALTECGGDAEKAAAKVKADEDYRVLDEVPFYFNGQGYINGTRGRLYLYDNGKIEALTPEETAVNLMAVSPDAKTLWYSAAEFEGLLPEFDRLYALDTKTLKVKDVSVSDHAQHYGVTPLEDGRAAVFASIAEKHGMNENPKIYLYENGACRLLYGDGAHCFNDSLLSDIKAGRALPEAALAKGGYVWKHDTQDDRSLLLRIDVETGAIENMTREHGAISEAVFYQDGFAIAALRGLRGPELYAVSMDGAETQLTHLNDALCAEYACSEPQSFTFKNERGSDIHGWAIPPVGMETGKKYPTILDIHGGPKCAYGGCYFHEMQLWASRGYAVIYCDPTGGDGRGDDFMDIFGDYGGIDYRDIMTFCDEAARRFSFIDAERMGVTGGSYGGFMTNWIIGHTDRFKAAASQRSISNFLSFYGTSDIGVYFSPDQTHGDPWSDPTKVWAQSPLKYADRAKTPTLFIHSDEDYRCPLSEGLQMFTALKAHGVPARLCMFKGENHELSRSGKPKHRVRRLKEITEWFDQYLKSE